MSIRTSLKVLSFPNVSVAIGVALLLLLLTSSTVFGAEQADPQVNMNPLVFFLLVLLACTAIGIVAVLGGVGGGVVFTPLMMGFTPIDSFVIRATGLLVAMAGALFAARPFLRRGLANTRILFFAAVSYSIFAMIGALMAGYIKATMGETGDAYVRLVLGILVLSIALLVLFAGKRVEYPEVKDVDSFTKKLGLAMSYWEASLDKVVAYEVKRAPVGVLLFCLVGLTSGLFGMGAGWAIVPVFNLVMLAPLKVAAASSTVLISIGDTAAVWPYMMSGAVFALFAAPSMIGMAIGTSIGARIMLRIRAGFIRWLVIGLMFLSGAKLIADGLGRLLG